MADIENTRYSFVIKKEEQDDIIKRNSNSKLNLFIIIQYTFMFFNSFVVKALNSL